MFKVVLTLLGGIAIGIAIVHFGFGSVDWTNVGEQTGEVVGDAATVAAVRTALALQKDFDLFGDIKVRAEDGKVTLSGRVTTDEQRRLAVLISNGVQGVREVIDNLSVGEGSAPGDVSGDPE